MGFSAASRQNALNYFFQVSTPSSPAPLWVSLHNGDTGETGATEFPFVGYGRHQMSAWEYVAQPAPRGQDAGTGEMINNGQDRIVRSFGLFQSQFDADFVFGAEVDNAPIAWDNGATIDWAAGGVGLQVNGQVGSDIQESIIKWFLGLTPSRPSNTYLSMHYGPTGNVGLNEFNSNGYERTGSITWQDDGNGQISNFNALATGPATPDWFPIGQDISHVGIWDAQVGGNFIIGGEIFPVPIGTPDLNNWISADIGTLTITATSV